MGPGPIRRTIARWPLASATVLLVIAACGGSSPEPTGATASGFPLGSFSKEVEDPDKGRVRMVWTFTADGRYTEVPFALDGQRLDAFPVRGTFTTDGATVTIATTFPPDMGTSTHGWRRDGDRLWTYLIESTNPDDKEWFEAIDSRPWTPVGS